MIRRIAVSLLGVLIGCALSARSAQPVQSPPARDTPAQKDAPPPPMGRITGRVLAADNGRPVRRARAYLSAPELPDGRGTLTDDSGVFEFTELPAGRYTLTLTSAKGNGSRTTTQPLTIATTVTLG